MNSKIRFLGYLLGLALAAAVLRAAPVSSGQEFRTDINPALLYYQAFILAPELDPADRDLIWGTNNWRGQELPPQLGAVLARYDNQFTAVRRAAKATVPCDWGIDMSTGPGTLLPHLARVKAVAQTARIRALWDLQKGDQNAAAQDLIAAFVLARNVAGDGTLISVLVQIASEAILRSVLTENFYQFSPETLQQIVQGWDAAPPRVTVSASVASEKALFGDWFLRKVQGWREANPSNDAKVMEEIHALLQHDESSEGELWEALNKASGGTSEGVIRLIEDGSRVTQRAAAILALPYSEFEPRMKELTDEVEKSGNVLAAQSLASFAKSRTREFRVLVDMAMVHAALEYKLHGEEGLKSVMDPCGQGPFGFQRFIFNGVDRGFMLKSAQEGLGFPHQLIFVEKDGPLFYCDGPKTGQGLKNPADEAKAEFERRYGIRPK